MPSLLSRKQSACCRWQERLVLPYLAAALMLIVWQGAAVSGLVRPVLLPAPADVLAALYGMLCSGELFRHLAASLGRVVSGFAIAAALGISLGIAMGMSARCELVLQGVMQFFRPIPPIAWLPLAVLWFGIGEGSKVFIIVLGSFFPIYTNVLQGVWQVSGKYLEVAEMFQVSRGRLLRQVILPSVLPYILAGCRSGLGYAWMCILAAELTSGLLGIGYLLVDARALAQTDRVMAGMAVIGITGKVMDSLLAMLLDAGKGVRVWKKKLAA